MAIDRLPLNFDQLLADAVRTFWSTRSGGTDRQEGSRGNVVGGKNLDGFGTLFAAVLEHVGLPQETLICEPPGRLTLPGYFRPTKRWDALVIHNGRLLAAFELKSQAGSFGNNFNNRTEEAIGNGLDFRAAHQHSALMQASEDGISPESTPSPFLGYLMLLEDCDESRSPVAIRSPHFPALPEFEGLSYADRYLQLLGRLVGYGLYDAASLVLSQRESGLAYGMSSCLDEGYSVRSMLEALAIHLKKCM